MFGLYLGATYLKRIQSGTMSHTTHENSDSKSSASGQEICSNMRLQINISDLNSSSSVCVLFVLVIIRILICNQFEFK